MATILRNHYVLAVPNAKRSASFFVDVLGFKIVRDGDGWVFVEKDGCMVMLGECPDDTHPSLLGCHNYFGYLRVDDVDGYHAEIQTRMGKPVGPPADRPWGMREFAITTTDGHRIMIGQTMAPGT